MTKQKCHELAAIVKKFAEENGIKVIMTASFGECETSVRLIHAPSIMISSHVGHLLLDSDDGIRNAAHAGVKMVTEAMEQVLDDEREVTVH